MTARTGRTAWGRKSGILDMLSVLTLPDPWTEECLKTDLEVVHCKFIIMEFMTSY